MKFAVKATLVYCFFAPTYAYCYLDPSTGSMVLQVAVGGVLATLTIVRLFWTKIKGLLKRPK